MKKMKKQVQTKIPKIKIDQIDLKSFLVEKLEVDPYWEDLYNPSQKPKQFKKR